MFVYFSGLSITPHPEQVYLLWMDVPLQTKAKGQVCCTPRGPASGSKARSCPFWTSERSTARGGVECLTAIDARQGAIVVHRRSYSRCPQIFQNSHNFCIQLIWTFFISKLFKMLLIRDGRVTMYSSFPANSGRSKSDVCRMIRNSIELRRCVISGIWSTDFTIDIYSRVDAFLITKIKFKIGASEQHCFTVHLISHKNYD